VLTEAVMKVAPVERPVASSSYSFMRFAGGAIAPYLAGKLAENVSPEAPFLVGATAVVIALVILISGRRHLAAAEDREPEAGLELALDEEPAGAIALERSAA
jgi:MFS transporter, ACDE family, multidrug resistance protein